MFNSDRSYIYNKAFAVWSENAIGTIRQPKTVKCLRNL